MIDGIIGASEPVPDVAQFGITAFTTTRAIGTFGTLGEEPVNEVMGRWAALRQAIHARVPRMATAGQVHGTHVLVHEGSWRGWLRGDDADGHCAPTRGTAVAVTVADCVPVFIAHPSGATMILHSGWRGTAAGILPEGLAVMSRLGISIRELVIHLGPAICGACYEVSADVFERLTGRNPGRPSTVDLRSILQAQAAAAGVTRISVSPWCTRCNNDRFYSHRAGDKGRQLGVMFAEQR